MSVGIGTRVMGRVAAAALSPLGYLAESANACEGKLPTQIDISPRQMTGDFRPQNKPSVPSIFQRVSSRWSEVGPRNQEAVTMTLFCVLMAPPVGMWVAAKGLGSLVKTILPSEDSQNSSF